MISTLNPLSQASCTGFHAGIVSICYNVECTAFSDNFTVFSRIYYIMKQSYMRGSSSVDYGEHWRDMADVADIG